MSSLSSLCFGWLCVWYLGSCFILVGMVIVVGVVCASVFGALFFLGGALYIVRQGGPPCPGPVPG